jgi:hypothetical protein
MYGHASTCKVQSLYPICKISYQLNHFDVRGRNLTFSNALPNKFKMDQISQKWSCQLLHMNTSYLVFAMYNVQCTIHVELTPYFVTGNFF